LANLSTVLPPWVGLLRQGLHLTIRGRCPEEYDVYVGGAHAFRCGNELAEQGAELRGYSIELVVAKRQGLDKPVKRLRLEVGQSGYSIADEGGKEHTEYCLNIS